MSEVKSVQETVFHRSLWLTGTYYICSIAAFGMSPLLAIVALGVAVDPATHDGKVLGVTSWVVAALSCFYGGWYLWMAARTYTKNRFVIAPDALRMRLPSSNGAWMIPSDWIELRWTGITAVTFAPKQHTCKIETADCRYYLDNRNCGRAREIAALAAQRAGVQLQNG